MTDEELSKAQMKLTNAHIKRSRQFTKAQTDAMMVYCNVEHDLGELQSENAKLRQQLADVTESMGRVEERCAALRVESDEWHRVAESKQSIIDHMRDEGAENAKLRELCEYLWEFAKTCGADHPFLRELGIEVN